MRKRGRGRRVCRDSEWGYVSMGARPYGRGLIFSPVAHVLDGPGPRSGIFLPWNSDIECWAANGPVRRDGGERQGLVGRVIRTCNEWERDGLAYLM